MSGHNDAGLISNIIRIGEHISNIDTAENEDERDKIQFGYLLTGY
jgi:hypothetical protein